MFRIVTSSPPRCDVQDKERVKEERATSTSPRESDCAPFIPYGGGLHPPNSKLLAVQTSPPACPEPQTFRLLTLP